MTDATPRKINQIWVLAALIGVLIVVRVSVFLFELDFLNPNRAELPWFLLLWVALTVTVSAAATLFGTRYLSKVTSLACGLCVGLLMGLGRALSGSPSALQEGAMLGLFVAFLVVMHWAVPLLFFFARCLVVGLIGYWGIGLSRRALIDYRSLALGLLLASVCVALQVVFVRQSQRWIAPWRNNLKASRVRQAALILFWLVLMSGSWFGGWHGEMRRRIRDMEARGGLVWMNQLPFSFYYPRPLFDRLVWGGNSTGVHLMANPTTSDMRTLEHLPRPDIIGINGEISPDLHSTLSNLPAVNLMAFLPNARISPGFFDGVKAPLQLHIQSPFRSVALAKELSRLAIKELWISDCQLEPQGLAALASSANLITLFLQGRELSDVELQALTGSKISVLTIAGKTKIRGEGLQHLSSMPNLWKLRMDHPIDAQGVIALEKMPALAMADIRVEELSREMIASLQKTQNGMAVTVTVEEISAREMRAAQGQLPKVRLEYGADPGQIR